MAVINKMGRVLLASGETASSESDELLLALLAIVGALLVAVITAGISLLSARRDRRRELYGEAVAAVSAWVELLYRVRRRGENAERELIDRAHDMQDELRFHSAWIGSESLFLKRSYDRMTRNVKSATEQLIRDAWQEPLRDPPGDARPEDVHPAVDEFMDSFLRDVRAQLSWLPPRKIAFFWRNRKGS